jgi:hypothetical protein
MLLGPTDMKNVLRLPDTYDLTYLRRWNGREGSRVDFAELARTTAGAFNIFNSNLTNGYWSRYVTTTTNLTADDEVGNDGGELPELAEYTDNDAVYADSTGHMIPMKDYGRLMSWTYWALRRGDNASLERQIRIFVQQAQNTWDKRLLTRLTKSTADTVGSAGKSVPFADGGVADDDYIPPANGGYTFDNTHTHFLRQTADATGRDAFLAAAGLHLRHHGINGPYDLVIPEADVASWAALVGTGTNHATYIRPTRDGILTTNVQVRALVNNGDYIGAIETDRDVFLIKPESRLPTNYAGVYKPMGFGNPMNPLIVRYEAGFPMGLTLIQEQPGVFPLQNARGVFTFGTGIGYRLAGVNGYFAASGSYVDPVIS